MEVVNKLSVSDLMKPRFKVVADYPENIYGVGTILPYKNDILYKHEYEYFDKYPHLFERLEWWQERKESDLPKYIKNTSGEVAEVLEWFINRIGVLYNKIRCGNEICDNQYYKACEPATLEEFEAYQKSNI